MFQEWFVSRTRRKEDKVFFSFLFFSFLFFSSVQENQVLFFCFKRRVCFKRRTACFKRRNRSSFLSGSSASGSSASGSSETNHACFKRRNRSSFLSGSFLQRSERFFRNEPCLFQEPLKEGFVSKNKRRKNRCSSVQQRHNGTTAQRHNGTTAQRHNGTTARLTTAQRGSSSGFLEQKNTCSSFLKDTNTWFFFWLKKTTPGSSSG